LASRNSYPRFHNLWLGSGRDLWQSTVSKFVTPQRKMAPVEGAIVLGGSLRSLAVVMVVVMMVVVMVMRLGTRNRANRERNSRDSGQGKSELPH
jgi:hypothetical protein